MNNTIETEKRKREVPIAELVHKSLVAHGIITNPRVVKCGTYYSWERHIKRRVRCGRVKECPMCYERTADLKRHEILKKQEECLKDGGSLFLVTLTMTHKKTDRLKYLQDKLSDSVRKLKNQHGWRKIREQSFMPPRTIYEVTYSEKNGFHPHVHMVFFQKNLQLTKTKIRETLSPYWNNYTGGNVDVGNVDNPTTYINKKEYDWVNVDDLQKSLGDLKRKTKNHFKKSELEGHFKKSELEGMVVCHDNIPDYKPPPPLTIESILKGAKEIRENQSYYKER